MERLRIELWFCGSLFSLLTPGPSLQHPRSSLLTSEPSLQHPLTPPAPQPLLPPHLLTPEPSLQHAPPQSPDPWVISTALPPSLLTLRPSLQHPPSPQTPFLIVLVFKTVSLTETWSSLIKLSWLASKTQGSFSLCLFKCWDYQHIPPCWPFYVGCREETESHAYTANTSWTELSP